MNRHTVATAVVLLSLCAVAAPTFFGTCQCSWYVGDTPVFNRVDDSQTYACTWPGVWSCTGYCDNLSNDNNFRTTSRQDACDALGRDVNTPWFMRSEVCRGILWLYQDSPVIPDLCCVNGQNSYNCNSS